MVFLVFLVVMSDFDCLAALAAGPQASMPFHHASEKAPPALTTAADTDINFLDVGNWVTYCNNHPKHSWAQLGTLRDKLFQQGFFDIDQLIGDHISHSDLAQCLGVGMGIAALIVRYAEEDVANVRTGTFNMNPAWEVECLYIYMTELNCTPTLLNLFLCPSIVFTTIDMSEIQWNEAKVPIVSQNYT